MSVSAKDLGTLARAVVKVADALAGPGTLDPHDADVAWARTFGASQAVGVGSDAWFREMFELRHKGCTCKPVLEADGEAFRATHDPRCALLRTAEWERGRQRARAERLAQARTVEKPVVPWSVFSKGRR